MFGWEFPPHNSGGLGVACKGISEALVQKNVDLTFVLPRSIDVEEKNINFKFADKIGKFQLKTIQSKIISPYGEVGKHLAIGENLTVSSPEHQYYYDLLNEVMLYAKNASRVALESDFDLIHAHDWLSFKSGIEAKKMTGKPLVAHIHATEYDRTGENPNPVIRDIELEGFLKADRIVAVSELTRQTVIQKYGIDPSKISVAYNGMDFSEIKDEEVSKADILRASKEAGYKIVLFLGRITFQKNPEIMLSAAVDILKYHTKTLFVYAGSGDMEQAMMHKAAELGISDKVIFAGFIRGDDKHKMFRIADVFLMPSISEPFGIVPLESLANNTPVIISKQSGISEILRSALKVDFWDVDEIVNKVVAVLMHTSLKNDLAIDGGQEIKSITWDKTAEELIKVYEEIV